MAIQLCNIMYNLKEREKYNLTPLMETWPLHEGMIVSHIQCIILNGVFNYLRRISDAVSLKVNYLSEAYRKQFSV